MKAFIICVSSLTICVMGIAVGEAVAFGDYKMAGFFCGGLIVSYALLRCSLPNKL